VDEIKARIKLLNMILVGLQQSECASGFEGLFELSRGKRERERERERNAWSKQQSTKTRLES